MGVHATGVGASGAGGIGPGRCVGRARELPLIWPHRPSPTTVQTSSTHVQRTELNDAAYQMGAAQMRGVVLYRSDPAKPLQRRRHTKRMLRLRGAGDDIRTQPESAHTPGADSFAGEIGPKPTLSVSRGPPLPSVDAGGPPFHSTLVEALEFVANSSSSTHGITYVEGDEPVFESYRELLANAHRTRYAIFNLGVRRGQPLVLQLTERQSHFHVLWACFLSSIQPVTIAIPSRYEKTNAVFLKLQGVTSQLAAKHLLASSRNVAPLRSLMPSAVRVHDLASLDFSVPSMGIPAPSVMPDDVVFYQLTSGSTGIPKCIPERHSAIISHIRHSTAHCGYAANDV